MHKIVRRPVLINITLKYIAYHKQTSPLLLSSLKKNEKIGMHLANPKLLRLVFQILRIWHQDHMRNLLVDNAVTTSKLTVCVKQCLWHKVVSYSLRWSLHGGTYIQKIDFVISLAIFQLFFFSFFFPSLHVWQKIILA